MMRAGGVCEGPTRAMVQISSTSAADIVAPVCKSAIRIAERCVPFPSASNQSVVSVLRKMKKSLLSAATLVDPILKLAV